MIIEARLQDMEDIYSLLCILENEQLNQKYFEEKYIQGLEDNNVYYYVFIENNKAVGFISLYIHNYLHHDQLTGEIVELVVNPNYRSQRIGHQLINYVESLAKQLHLEEIELSTSTYRKRAHHFYEVHGYIMNHYNYIKTLK